MWIKLNKNKKYVEKEGFLVIAPNEFEDAVPFFCPDCNGKIKNFNDVMSYKKFKVCNNCEIKNGFVLK